MIFEWRCTKIVTSGGRIVDEADCDYLFGDTATDTDNSQIEAFFMNETIFDWNETDIFLNYTDAVDVEFIFEMTVHDDTVDTRDSCTAYRTVRLTNVIFEQENEEITTKFLDVSNTQTNTNMNENDRLRLIVAVNSYDDGTDKINDSSSYTFIWSELNGHLTIDEINLLRVNDINEANLILESGSLESDTTN